MFDEIDDHEDNDNKIPGEDEEPDMQFAQADDLQEVLIPVKPKKHGGLFGCDLSSVKY